MRTYRPRTGPNPQNRISNFDKNLQEKGIRDLSLKTSISENRHGAQISEVLPHFGEEKAPQPLVRRIAVDTVRPDERGREDRALLGASENAEVRRAAERVRGLKRNARHESGARTCVVRRGTASEASDDRRTQTGRMRRTNIWNENPPMRPAADLGRPKSRHRRHVRTNLTKT